MSAILPSLLVAPLIAGVVAGDADFEAPVAITSAGEIFSNVIFPTPVLQDMNDDGTRELVIGDLVGNIWICDAGDSDVDWAKAVQAQAGGKPLKLNNW